MQILVALDLFAARIRMILDDSYINLFFSQLFPTVNVNPAEMLEPHLEIVEQPTDKPFRFRYKSEMHGTHGSLMGIHNDKAKRTYPTVALRNFNFASKAMIRCSLYQVPNEAGGEARSPHSHQLVIRRGDNEESDPHDFEVSNHNDFTAM